MLSENFKNIFRALNAAGVRYVVLRNYFPVENLAAEKDIDILVHPKDKSNFKNILKAAGFRNRLIPLAEWNHFEMFKFEDEDENGGVYLFDIQKDLFFGREKIKIGNISRIFEKRELLNDFLFVPHSIHSFVLLMLHLAMDKENINDKRISQANYLLNGCVNNKDFFEIIKNDFGESLYNVLSKVIGGKTGLITLNHFKEINNSINILDLVNRKNLFFSLLIKIKIIFSKVIILFRPVKLVVFIGVDGSGKTTIMNKLKEMSPVFKNCIYLGWKDYFFKFMGRLDRTRPAERTADAIANKINYFLFHFLLPVDFFIRYLRAKRNAKYGMVLSDRFPLEKIYSAEGLMSRIQYQYRKFFLALTYFILPRPLAVFILTGDPEILWERKKEGSYKKFLSEFERIERAKDTFSSMSIVINNDCDITESFNKVSRELCHYLNK